jgi:hypothetical protein
MRTIVIYPGRFQPGHKGHKSSYDFLANKFGEENVYVATSDVTAPVTNPFSFADKTQMLTKLGIPSGHIVKVRNPYQAQEITKDISDPEHTALVFAVSEKDMHGEDARFKFGVKKNGDPSYMQPYPEGGKLKPLTKHAYVMVTPTVNFKVKGKDANSASEIRKIYSAGNEADRKQIIHDLYGEADKNIEELFNKKLGVAQKAKEVVIQQPPIDANVIDVPPPQGPMSEHKQKLAKLLESTLLAERTAAKCYAPFIEDLRPNYIDEKTGRKFYGS